MSENPHAIEAQAQVHHTFSVEQGRAEDAALSFFAVGGQALAPGPGRSSSK
jgi:hypothetical protein